MSKTRNCRYTDEERAVHAEAVRLRKMTDRQLVEEVRAAKKTATPPEPDNRLERLLSGLAAGECKGVKGAIAYRVQEYAKERGLIE